MPPTVEKVTFTALEKKKQGMILILLAISLGNISAPATYAIAFPISYKYISKNALFCVTPTLQKDKSQNFSLKFTFFLSLCNQLMRANIIIRDNSSKKVLLYYGILEKKRVADR